MLWLTVRTK